MQYFTVSFILLIVLIPSISSLTCYVCNSNSDKECEGTGNSLEKFLSNCSSPDPYCRKIDQIVNGKNSIVRACGSKASSKSCYKTVGINNANVCSCNTDACNSAKVIRPKDLVLFNIFVGTIFILLL